MKKGKVILALFFLLPGILTVSARSINIQKGCVLEKVKNVRLSKISVKNKTNGELSRTDLHGMFSIKANVGDTLEFTGDNFEPSDAVISNFADMFVYMKPGNQLNEVVIRENSQIQDLKQTLADYRVQGVLYLRNPRYYYRFCKPMTFIYENFKSEMIQARRFKRYTAQTVNSMKVSERYNEAIIKDVVPAINDIDLLDFMNAYRPTLAQLNSWSNYDLINYISSSYEDYKKNKAAIKSQVEL